jgi:L-cysteine/cystine lyase
VINVEAVRAQIPACQHGIYLNTGWSGPSPTPVIEAIRAQLELDATLGPASPAALAAQREINTSTRLEVAELLGVGVDEIVLLENTTEGINVVLNGLQWNPGDEVVTFAIEHSSVLIPTVYLQRMGVRPKVIELAPDEPHESILARLDAAMTSNTRLVALSYVQFGSGLRMPVAEICERAHARGARVLTDAAQAIGQISVDLRVVPVDYLAMPGQKWLLGPDGTGALFIRRSLIRELEPRKVAGTAGSYDVATGLLEPRTDSTRKFELTTSSPALRSGLRAAIRFIRDAGLSEIEARNGSLASKAKRLLAEVPGVTIISPREPAGSTGLVSFQVGAMANLEVVDALWERWRIAARSVAELSAVRVSLHFFNTEDEVEQLVAAVRTLAGG